MENVRQNGEVIGGSEESGKCEIGWWTSWASEKMDLSVEYYNIHISVCHGGSQE